MKNFLLPFFPLSTTNTAELFPLALFLSRLITQFESYFDDDVGSMLQKKTAQGGGFFEILERQRMNLSLGIKSLLGDLGLKDHFQAIKISLLFDGGGNFMETLLQHIFGQNGDFVNKVQTIFFFSCVVLDCFKKSEQKKTTPFRSWSPSRPQAPLQRAGKR